MKCSASPRGQDTDDILTPRGCQVACGQQQVPTYFRVPLPGCDSQSFRVRGQPPTKWEATFQDQVFRPAAILFILSIGFHYAGLQRSDLEHCRIKLTAHADKDVYTGTVSIGYEATERKTQNFETHAIELTLLTFRAEPRYMGKTMFGKDTIVLCDLSKNTASSSTTSRLACHQ